MLKETFLTLHDAEDHMRVTTNVRYKTINGREKNSSELQCDIAPGCVRVET